MVRDPFEVGALVEINPAAYNFPRQGVGHVRSVTWDAYEGGTWRYGVELYLERGTLFDSFFHHQLLPATPESVAWAVAHKMGVPRV